MADMVIAVGDHLAGSVVRDLSSVAWRNREDADAHSPNFLDTPDHRPRDDGSRRYGPWPAGLGGEHPKHTQQAQDAVSLLAQPSVTNAANR